MPGFRSMKRQLLPYIVLVLLSAACTDRLSEMQEIPSGTASVSAGDAYVPGVFRVKVSEDSPELDTRIFTRSGGSGSATFDRAAARAGAVGLSRVFSDGDRFRERRRKAGLHRWYDVRFSEDIPVAEAIAKFGKPEGVVCVEPVCRMVPTSERYPGPRCTRLSACPGLRSTILFTSTSGSCTMTAACRIPWRGLT